MQKQLDETIELALAKTRENLDNEMPEPARETAAVAASLLSVRHYAPDEVAV